MAQNDDLNVLFPERSLRVNGEELTFREITLSQQLKHRARIKPISDAFTALATRLAASGAEPSVDEILDIMADHADDLAFLIPLSCGKDADWYESLTGEDGDNVLLTWWTVNTGFFCRAAARPMLEKMALETMRSDTAASSPISSTADTGSTT